jgi:hypothetical protein
MRARREGLPMSIIAPPHPVVKPDHADLAPDPILDRAPYTAADLAWAAVALNEHAADFEVLEDEGLEWPGTRDEYERWLDVIAPTAEELEHRDRCDAFLGHDD